MKILIFEDKELNQKTIDVNLEKWKCKTFLSDNFEKGVKILERHDIDIILIDLRTPNGYGLEIVSHIRNHQIVSIQNIPIMAVSADHNIKNNVEFDVDNFNDFLLKPYSSDELLLKLTNLKH